MRPNTNSTLNNGVTMKEKYIGTPIFEIVSIVEQTNSITMIQHKRMPFIEGQYHDSIETLAFQLAFKRVKNTSTFFSQCFIMDIEDDTIFVQRSINGFIITPTIKSQKSIFKKRFSNLDFMKNQIKDFPEPFPFMNQIELKEDRIYNLAIVKIFDEKVLLLSNDCSEKIELQLKPEIISLLRKAREQPTIPILFEGIDSQGNLHCYLLKSKASRVPLEGGHLLLSKEKYQSFLHLS